MADHTLTVKFVTDPYSRWEVCDAKGKRVGFADRERSAKAIRRNLERADKRIKAAWLAEQHEAREDDRGW